MTSKPPPPGPFPLFFDDLCVGMSFVTPAATVTEEAIIRFSLEWDYQSFHADKVAATKSIFGGLVASGLHSLCLAYRLYNDMGLMRDSALAGVGMENVRWIAPTRPGDTIRSTVSILALSPRETKRGGGKVRLGFETVNQQDERLLRFELLSIVAGRAYTKL